MPDQARQNADARLRFGLSKDGMRLGISRYDPPVGQGLPLTVERIKKQIRQAGVTLDPVPGACKRVLAYLKQGRDVRKIVLVRGVLPAEASDAQLVPEGDLRMPVFAGSVVARKQPAGQAQPGRTVDGRTLTPKSTAAKKVRDKKFKAGENCTYDSTRLTFTATCYGLTTIDKDTVSIIPGLSVDEDLVQVLGIYYYKDNLGMDITPDRFEAELEEMGVTTGPAESSLKRAYDESSHARKLLRDVVVAEGKAPLPGEDGYLEMLVEGSAPNGVEDESGRIDYRERGTLPMAMPGERIARLHPPMPGQGGIDVYGKTIPARGGKPIAIYPGDGVRQENDEIYTATTQGIVSCERNQLTVSEVLVVPRDVDIATGNIRPEMGSVRVRGSVLAGLVVDAPKHVVIEEVVESANIAAQGSVEVKGGVMMPDGGLIKAGGSVSASFATNARIEAKGEVVIHQNATNSLIETQDSFYCTRGRGVIQGGTVTFHRTLEANEIGTELGVVTTIVATVKKEARIPLIKARTKIHKEVAKLDGILGHSDPKELLAKTPPANRKRVAELYKYRIRLQKKNEQIGRIMRKDAKRHLQALGDVRIRVRKTIHPGVVLKIGGRVYNVTKPISRSMVRFNPETKQIVICNL